MPVMGVTYTMAIRVFQCARCGHEMRLGGAACGACGDAKSVLQRPLLVLGLLVMLGAAVAAFTLSQAPVDQTAN